MRSQKALTAMANDKINDILAELHLETAKDLLARVKSGEATPGELNAALKMLKDNGIEALPTPENPLGDLANALPQFIDNEETGLQ